MKEGRKEGRQERKNGRKMTIENENKDEAGRKEN